MLQLDLSTLPDEPPSEARSDIAADTEPVRKPYSTPELHRLGVVVLLALAADDPDNESDGLTYWALAKRLGVPWRRLRKSITRLDRPYVIEDDDGTIRLQTDPVLGLPVLTPDDLAAWVERAGLPRGRR